MNSTKIKLSSNDERDIIVSEYLSAWRQSQQRLISIDADLYPALFDFVPIVSIVRDKNNNPLFILLDRQKALKLVEGKYNLHYGKEVSCRG